MSTMSHAQTIPAHVGPALPSLPVRLWRGLRSLRFAVVLMVLIALACVVGTLVKQEPYDPKKMFDQYGRRIGSLVGLVGLNELYGTFWFLGLLGLFAFSTVACALPRLRWRPRAIGFAAVHLSIVFIVAGALVRGLVGVSGTVAIREGQTVDSFRVGGRRDPVPLGFRLRLDDFAVRRHPDSWTDLLTIAYTAGGQVWTRRVAAEAGKVVSLDHEGTEVEVVRLLPHAAPNEPAAPALEVRVRGRAGAALTRRVPLNGHHGHPKASPEAAAYRRRLAQLETRAYRAGGDVVLARLDGEAQPRTLPVSLGKAVPLGSDGTTVEVLRRLADLRSSDGRVFSASDEPRNPAIEVRVRGPAGDTTRWLYMKFPGFGGHGSGPAGPELHYQWRPAPAVADQIRALREAVRLASVRMEYAREYRVKAYESRVTVVGDPGQALREATILVNRPLKVGGYTLYQVDYDKQTERTTVLEVVRDPGVPLVFTGFALMPLGMVFVFYVQPLLGRRKRKDA